MSRGKGKGSGFERDVCKQLSLWWTGTRDDVFWRSASSGGRATQRHSKNQSTFGQHGDISATDPIGIPLIRMMVVEIKRGYNGKTMMDLLDAPRNAAEQCYEEWLRKLAASCEASGTPYWILIHRRDRRQALIYFPDRLAIDLDGVGVRWCSHNFKARIRTNIKGATKIVGMRFDDWLEEVDPNHVRKLIAQLGGE